MFIVVNSNPNIKVEVVVETAVGDSFFVRLYVADRNGGYEAQANSGINPWKSWGNQWEQLTEMLKYSGVNTDSKVFLPSATKEQAVQAILKWIREVFLPALVAAINVLLGKDTSTGSSFNTPEELLGAALQRIKFTVNPDGSVSASI